MSLWPKTLTKRLGGSAPTALQAIGTVALDAIHIAVLTTRAIEAMSKAERLGILDGAIVAIGTRSRPRGEAGDLSSR